MAAPSATAAAPGPGGITLAPAHALHGVAASRSYFVRTVAPGGHFTDAVRVTNASAHPVRLVVSAVDGVTATTTGAAYGGATTTGDAGWVSAATTSVVVPAHGSLLEPFTVQVPKNARPGDHLAGLSFASPTALVSTRGPLSIRTIYRNVIGVETKVSGPAAKKFALTSQSLGAGDGTGLATATVTIANVGNLLSASNLSVSVDRVGYHHTVARPLGVILARQSVAYRVPWPTKLPAGAYTMTSVLSGKDFATVRLVSTLRVGALDGGPSAAIRPFATSGHHAPSRMPSIAVMAGVAAVALLVPCFAFVAFARRRRDEEAPAVMSVPERSDAELVTL